MLDSAARWHFLNVALFCLLVAFRRLCSCWSCSAAAATAAQLARETNCELAGNSCRAKTTHRAGEARSIIIIFITRRASLSLALSGRGECSERAAKQGSLRIKQGYLKQLTTTTRRSAVLAMQICFSQWLAGWFTTQLGARCSSRVNFKPLFLLPAPLANALTDSQTSSLFSLSRD